MNEMSQLYSYESSHSHVPNTQHITHVLYVERNVAQGNFNSTPNQFRSIGVFNVYMGQVYSQEVSAGFNIRWINNQDNNSLRRGIKILLITEVGFRSLEDNYLRSRTIYIMLYLNEALDYFHK